MGSFQLPVSGYQFVRRLRDGTLQGSVDGKDWFAIPPMDTEGDNDCDTPIVVDEVALSGQPGPGMMAYDGDKFMTLQEACSPEKVQEAMEQLASKGWSVAPVEVTNIPNPSSLSAVIAACSEQVQQAYAHGRRRRPVEMVINDDGTWRPAKQGEKAHAVANMPVTESTSATGEGDLIEVIVRPQAIDDATRAKAKELIEKYKRDGSWIALPSKHPVVNRKIVLKVPEGKPLESFECRPVEDIDGTVLYTVFTLILPPGTEIELEDHP